GGPRGSAGQQPAESDGGRGPRDSQPHRPARLDQRPRPSQGAAATSGPGGRRRSLAAECDRHGRSRHHAAGLPGPRGARVPDPGRVGPPCVDPGRRQRGALADALPRPATAAGPARSQALARPRHRPRGATTAVARRDPRPLSPPAPAI
ncbi:MAG: hypothetical protein AVDCRST_MAG49-2479, partial [uncultured Thermomicrobiales bacterium]